MERPSDARGTRQRRAARAKHVRHTKVREPAPFPRAKPINRKSLLSGTALASTLLLGTMFAPAPAHAVVNCPAGTGPAPLSYLNQTDDIVCLNTEPRDGGAGGGIELQTIVGAYYIDVTNTATGTLTGGIGIAAETQASGSPISIDNAATIDTVARGIEALALGSFSPVTIVNSGAITAALGIFAGSTSDSPITITNSGRLDTELGIEAESGGDNSDIVIDNYGPISATVENGIAAYTCGRTSTASRSAATPSPSTTRPMSEAASACASARPIPSGAPPRSSRSSSAVCGAISAATIRRRWSPPAPPSASRTISTTCGARSRPV